MKAIIFDVFETLVRNGSDLWLDSFSTICRVQQLPINPLELRDNWWVCEKQFRSRRLDRKTMVLREPFETYEQVWKDCFQNVFDRLQLDGDAGKATGICIDDLSQRPVFPEVIPILQQLRKTFTLAIISNADCSFLYPLLRFHGIQDIFSCIVSSEEAQAYKPHPSIFELAVTKLGFPLDQVIHVGDTVTEDVWGGNLVGIHTGWLNRGHEERRTFLDNDQYLWPDFELHNLEDLARLFRE